MAGDVASHRPVEQPVDRAALALADHQEVGAHLAGDSLELERGSVGDHEPPAEAGHETHGRILTIHLTEAGRRALAEALAVAAVEEERMLRGF
jgi:hypothetical protein